VSRQRLTEGEVAARLRDLPGWQLSDGKLHRAWSFEDFAEAWAFMTDVAHAAGGCESPSRLCNELRTVTVDLVTRRRGLTALDFERRQDERGRPAPGRRAWMNGRVAIVTGGAGPSAGRRSPAGRGGRGGVGAVSLPGGLDRLRRCSAPTWPGSPPSPRM
jgi:4a-hydroxytetrahydrobiopterin dehydratase